MSHVPNSTSKHLPFVPLAWQLTLASLLVSTLALAAVAYFSATQTRAEFRNLLGEQQRAQVAAQVAVHLEGGGTLTNFRPNVGTTGYINTPLQGPFVLTDANFQPIMTPHRHVDGSPRRHSPIPTTAYSGPSQNWNPTAKARAEAKPVQVDGHTVAFVVPNGRPNIESRAGQQFMARVTSAVVWAAAGSAVAAALLGWLLSRWLLRPLDWLRLSMADLRAGRAAPPLLTRAVRDELGEVINAFGDMHTDVLQTRQRERKLTANIAHDLGTPLTALRGGLEAMRDGTLPPTPERLARLEGAAERMARLLADLRLLAQTEAGELPLHSTPIDACSVLESCAVHFAAAAETAGVQLKIQTVPGLSLCADEHRLRQVLDNLVVNALTYAFQGGDFQNKQKGAYITLSARAKVNTNMPGVQLCVSDNGSGVPQESLPHLFERLYRADESRGSGGSGLGLSIARGIIEAHGGHIWAEQNESSGGLRVCMWLPIECPS